MAKHFDTPTRCRVKGIIENCEALRPSHGERGAVKHTPTYSAFGVFRSPGVGRSACWSYTNLANDIEPSAGFKTMARRSQPPPLLLQ